jgi:multiple sugar transport system permease protein
MTPNKNTIPIKLSFYIVVALVIAYNLAPFLWQILTSLKTDAEITAWPVQYLPRRLNLEHYTGLFGRKPFANYLFNSLRISFLSTVCCLFLASLAGYGFSRLKVPGRNALLAAIVSVSFFPAIVFFIPLYEVVRSLGLVNNAASLVFVYTAMNLPFAILLLTNFFQSVPVSLEEAAAVDGLNRAQTLAFVILPLSTPALVTTGIIVFISSWNEFIFAISFINREVCKTVPAGIASLGSATYYEVPWGQLTAATVVSTLPLIVLVLAAQRHIISGLTQGVGKQ